MSHAQSNGGAAGPGQGGIAIWVVTDPTKPKTLRQNFLLYDSIS